MSIPFGFSAFLLLVLSVACNAFPVLLYFMKINKTTFLSIVMLLFLSVIFDFTFKMNERLISVGFSFLLIMMIFVQLYVKSYFHFGFKSLLGISFIGSILILGSFTAFMADYHLMISAPYWLVPLAVLILVICSCNFRCGLEAVLGGYLFSEFILLFLQDGHVLSLGGTVGINVFFAMLFFYFLFFWIKGRLCGFVLHDIY